MERGGEERTEEEKNSGDSHSSTGGSSREQEVPTAGAELRTTHSSGVGLQGQEKRLHLRLAIINQLRINKIGYKQ